VSCDSFRVWTLLAPYGDRPLLPSCTRRLDELGVRLVVLDERHGLPSCDDVPRALDALRAYARTHPCDGVLVQTECGLLPGALFAAERGLPAVSPVAAYYATNRIAALRRLQAAGVPVPAFDLVSEAGEIRAFAATHGYPIVLRAVTSTLGRNVLRVPDAEAVFAALTELQARARLSPDLRRLEGLAEVLQLDLGFDPRGAFVVERCVDGDAVEVDGVCLRDPIPFGVADLRVTTDPGFYLEGHLFPSRRTPAETAAVRAVAVRAVQALGLRFAGFAVELRLGSAGPVVVEVTARLPEDDALDELYDRVLGIDPLQLAVLTCAFARIVPMPQPTGGAAVAYRNVFTDAVLRDVHWLASTDLTVRTADRGCAFHAPPHPELQPHAASVLATHPLGAPQAYARASEVADSIRLVLESTPTLTRR